MKCLVYTCVFGGYDWVFPPICPENGLTYVIVTDDPGLRVSGWQSFLVDIRQFNNAQTANRYYKTLIHRVLKGYDCSLYIDGNIRLLGYTSEFFSQFIASEMSLGLYLHPLRSSVHEEIEVCLSSKKVASPERLAEEFDYYSKDGFPDNVGLFEAGVLLKNHLHPELDSSMELWWQLFERFGTRDQTSLPYVLWKTGVSCMYHENSFREPNPYFGIYTHRGDLRAPRYYGYVEGRAFDNLFYAVILCLWQFTWTVRRVFRQRPKSSGG